MDSPSNGTRFHWLRDREAQGQFWIHWRPGKTNLADYFTKHHPPSHHQRVRSRYLQQANNTTIERHGQTDWIQVQHKNKIRTENSNSQQVQLTKTQARKIAVQTRTALQRTNTIQRLSLSTNYDLSPAPTEQSSHTTNLKHEETHDPIVTCSQHCEGVLENKAVLTLAHLVPSKPNHFSLTQFPRLPRNSPFSSEDSTQGSTPAIPSRQRATTVTGYNGHSNSPLGFRQ